MKELRRTNRFFLQRTVLCNIRGRSYLGTVRDLSLTGLRLRCSAAVSPDDPVTVVLLGQGGQAREVPCLVAWCDQNEAGLTFQSSPQDLCHSWIGELLGELEVAGGRIFQSRTTVRVPVRLPARAVATTGPATYIEVVELSQGGARIRSRREFAPRVPLQLRISLKGQVHQLDATVMAVRQRGIGQTEYSLKFSELTPAQSEALSRTVKAAAAQGSRPRPALRDLAWPRQAVSVQ